MTTNQITHRNHYVPQLYLKMWSSNGITLYTYDTVAPNNGVKVWRSSPIKSSACWTDFYTRIIDGADNDDVETYLDERYEAPAKIVFEKISKNVLLSPEDTATLIDFLTIQMCRTPGWYLKISDMYPKAFESASTEVFEHINDASKRGTLEQEIQETLTSPQRAEVTGFNPPLKIEIDPNSGLIEIDTVVGRSIFLETIKQIEVGAAGKALRSHCWRIVEVPVTNPLPTSDNPVMLLSINQDGSYNFDGGVAQKNVDIIMPLTPRHFLFTEVGKNRTAIDSIVFDEAKITFIRNAIIDNATRYIYAIRPIDEIQNIRPRIIDPEYYHKLNESRINWHRYQTELESKFL